ncbi:MAG: flagellin [Proteobacteria bacterium SG_bin7]|nr:MAG: flagellin [Proteobacteria bacterium SG_bin7]
MPLRVNTNIVSINAQRAMADSQRGIERSYAQLASGSRITKAADDAAGLSISENLKSRVRGYRQAQRNAQDAMSVVQIAEGGLNEISNIVTRLRELGVQAASDNIGDQERGFVNKEVQQLISESERIAQSTRFGNTMLLNGSGDKFSFQIDINNDDFRDRISFDASQSDATTASLGIDGFDFSSAEGARSALDTIEEALSKVNGYRANLGAIQNRLISTDDNLGVAVENLSAANSRIRDADIAASTADLTKNNILLNATSTVLAQANQFPAIALKLLG